MGANDDLTAAIGIAGERAAPAHVLAAGGVRPKTAGRGAYFNLRPARTVSR
jgi:hypothetical protein